MLLAAWMFAGVYTVFAPIFAGKKHFYIGIVVFVLLFVLLLVTGTMK